MNIYHSHSRPYPSQGTLRQHGAPEVRVLRQVAAQLGQDPAQVGRGREQARGHAGRDKMAVSTQTLP